MRALSARDFDEEGRAATPLELLFDLVVVIALSPIAAALHHSHSEGHLWFGSLHFVMSFFTIWWSWMLFVWLSSGFDNDDLVYRLLVFLMMIGAIIVAASANAFSEGGALVPVWVGYLLMRAGYLLLWCRVAFHDERYRSTAVFLVSGQVLLQIGWIAFAWFGQSDSYSLFFALVAAEVLLPVIVFSKKGSCWHPEHIQERFGLLFIIILGEVLVGTVSETQLWLAERVPGAGALALTSFTTCFLLWWLFFARNDDTPYVKENRVFRMLFVSYLQFPLAMCGTAFGVLFSLMSDGLAKDGEISQSLYNLYSLNLALFVCLLWIGREQFYLRAWQTWALSMIVLALILCVFLEASAQISIVVFALTLPIVKANSVLELVFQKRRSEKP